ncbi:adenine DNA glycosylase [Cynara cardunculus var. scolymus]|uniref:Adenine DNA glycosylase n=1 Tax=Cynara cardunculus var. scolymus TaxID=59895 RepID=A0A103YLZ2_CYNCS|nr:adenine DNA glycosylase [Cynara cardunculus var. scolymus]KVI11470.1 A/G-specific adenine glycosylase MutY, bacterial form [Cynara cardunculus var. scolymus]
MKKKPKNSTAAVAGTITKPKKRTRNVCEPKPKPEPGFTTEDIEDFQFREDEVGEIRASLLKWYDVNKRDLPWRRINDGDATDDGERDRKAYAVWVSEIMLQQTRVQTVINYFNRWMEKWPSVHHLAQASIEEVNEMWAGLGYYRRARFLLEGAKMIVEEGGRFPKSVNDLRKVRGIGEYTAGAIASIAFNEAVPVVDGNVVRVIARLKTISANPKDTATVKNIWRLAGQLVDVHRPGDFNQALMELGATLCTPLSPSCSSCPVSAQCSALSDSKHNPSMLVTDYPTKVAKVRQRHDFSAISVVEILEGEEDASKFLLVKRPEEGLLAGLWEFPSVSMNGEADVVTRRQAIDDFLKSSFGLSSSNVIEREEVGEYVHIFTHIRLKMYIELLVLRSRDVHRKEEKAVTSYKYVDTKTLASMGLSTGVRKAYNMVQKFKQTRSNLISR